MRRTDYRDPESEQQVSEIPTMGHRETVREEVAMSSIGMALLDGPQSSRTLRVRLCSDRFPDAMLYRLLYRMEVRSLVERSIGMPVLWQLKWRQGDGVR